MELYSASVDLEKEMKAGGGSAAATRLDEFLLKLGTVLENRSILETYNEHEVHGNGVDHGDDGAVESLLEQLKDELAGNSFNAVQTFSRLSRLVRGIPSEDIKELGMRIDAFEFKRAYEITSGMLQEFRSRRSQQTAGGHEDA